MFRRKKLKHKKKQDKRSIFLKGWFLAICVFCLLCIGGAYLGFHLYTQGYRDKAAEYNLDLIRDVERPNIILDRFNREVGRIFVENRSEIPIEQVPQKMIDSLVAGEDSRFYTHDGVDYMGIARAAKGNLQSGNADSGASTLTMQLARNAFPLQADSVKSGGDKYDRKFVEIYLAHRIEEKFSKDQIIEFYLNRVPFGSGFYGIRSASLGYFGKEPRDLHIWECASLVGSIKNPSLYSPLRRPENNKKSRDNVLNRMEIEGFITAEECAAYIQKPVITNPKPLERGTSYFYDRVTEFVQKTISEQDREGGGLKIFTTLDKSLQDEMERGIQEELYLVEKKEGYKHPKYEDFTSVNGSKANYLQGAGLCFNSKTGAVLAYVGGRDFKHSQYDFIQSGKRPLGTGFLPIVYASAVENGVSLSTPVIDEAMDNRMVMVSGQEGILAEWGAETMEPRYEGFIPARKGLAYSKIAATVRLGKDVGLDKVNATAERFGLSMPRTRVDKRILTRGLIGSESVSVLDASLAYSVIGNQGKRPKELLWVTRIETQHGKLLYESKGKAESERILDEEDAYFIHSGLQDVWKNGNLKDSFSKNDNFEFKGGVKTGTTSDFADHWAIGYNGDLTCAIWSGFFSGNQPIYEGAFAKDTVLPVWKSVMKKATNDYKVNEMKKPDSLVSVLVCSRSGLKCTQDCHDQHHDAISGKVNYLSTGVMELFTKGEEPTGYCDVHGDYTADVSSFAANGSFTTKDLLYVLPVRPQIAGLVGNDPYGAVIPEFDPYQNNAASLRSAGTGLDLYELDQLDEAARIFQPRPGRVFIDQ